MLRALVLMTVIAFPCAVLADAPRQTVATFSIVAYDPANGDLGVAVSSKVLAVGTVVPWARTGVGAIATQAYANTTFGPRGLAMLKAGKSAAEVLKALLDADPRAAQRQLAIVDAKGGVAVHTGKRNSAWCGSRGGTHHSCQGNLLAGEKVVMAMDKAFSETPGELAERLMAALVAAQAAGGDKRGRQSAALLVVRKKGGYGGYDDRYIDLRVDDHATPVAELKRILGKKLGWVWLRKANRMMLQGQLEAAEKALERTLVLSPKLGWGYYLRAKLYAKRADQAKALEMLTRAIKLDAAMRRHAANEMAFRAWRDQEAWKKLLDPK